MMNLNLSWSRRQWLMSLCVFIVAGVVVWFIFSKYLVKESPPSVFKFEEHGFSGDVLAINGNVLTISGGRVFTGDGNNFVNREDKKITIGKDTVLTKTSNINGKVTVLPATIRDFTVGSRVVIYSATEATDQNTITPTRLDVNL